MRYGPHTMLLFAVILPVWVVLVLLTFWCTWVKINISPSLPYGLYRITDVTTPLTRGMLVVVTIKDWSPSYAPFLKPVAGVAGDAICRRDGRLFIHGQDYGMVHAQWRGVALPSPLPAEGCFVIPPGQVFLATTMPNSLDSRYYGAVSVAQISATARPLFVWGNAYASTRPEP